MMRAAFFLLALSLAGPASAAQPIGRLFFTPTERAQLDIQRSQKRVPETAAAQAPERRPTTEVITYSGIVRRSDGKSILWLNNKPADEKEALSGLSVTGRVRPDGAVVLQVPETGGSINLRVGQRAEMQTGRVAESRRDQDKAAAKGDAAAKADTTARAEVPAKPETAAKSAPPSARGAEAEAQDRRAASPAAGADGVSHGELQNAARERERAAVK
jgi:hypothetical protein